MVARVESELEAQVVPSIHVLNDYYQILQLKFEITRTTRHGCSRYIIHYAIAFPYLACGGVWERVNETSKCTRPDAQ